MDIVIVTEKRYSKSFYVTTDLYVYMFWILLKFLIVNDGLVEWRPAIMQVGFSKVYIEWI